MKKSFFATSCIVAFALCGTLKADIVRDYSGLDDLTQCITFDEEKLHYGTNVTDQYNGVYFSPKLYQTYVPGGYLPKNIQGGALKNYGLFKLIDPFYIKFDEVQTRASFSMFTLLPGSTDFSLYRGGELVESASLYTSPTTSKNYYQFLSDEGFDKIKVNVNGEHKIHILNYFDKMKLDNLKFGAVPEPSTYAMIFFGLAGLLLYARRRQDNQLAVMR